MNLYFSFLRYNELNFVADVPISKFHIKGTPGGSKTRKGFKEYYVLYVSC